MSPVDGGGRPRELTEFEKARAAGRLRPIAFIRGDASEEELMAFADLLAGNEPLPCPIDAAPAVLEHGATDDPETPATGMENG